MNNAFPSDILIKALKIHNHLNSFHILTGELFPDWRSKKSLCYALMDLLRYYSIGCCLSFSSSPTENERECKVSVTRQIPGTLREKINKWKNASSIHLHFYAAGDKRQRIVSNYERQLIKGRVFTFLQK